MKKKLVLALAMILVVVMAFSACGTKEAPADGGGSSSAGGDSSAPAEKAEVQLMVTQHDPDNSLPGQYLHAWAAMVKEKSNGRIEVVVNNGGSLAGPTESLDKVKAGSVDLAWGLQSFYPGQFTMTDGLTLPYLPYKDAAQASEAMWEIWDTTDLLKSDTGYEGTKVILIRSNCDAPITTASKKLEKASDLNGMTIRASAEPLVKWLAEFGATGKGCPITELYQNLQNGAFDGALTDWHGIESFRLYDNCADYFADEAVQFNTYYFLMNEAKYDSLSDENKKVIDECSGEAALELMKGAWDDMTKTAKDNIEAAGGTVYQLPAEEHQLLVDAAAKITEGWMDTNGENGKALIDKIYELTK